MTAAALLMRLTELDVHLKVENQHLDYDAPVNVLTDDLLSEMREHKEELVDLLEDPLQTGMPLSRIAGAGQYRQVHSKVLGDIILAADDADLPDVGDTVVYRASEARLLVGLPAEKVRAFHEVKVFFDGIIETHNESQINAADVMREGLMR
jgi:hypothetical protein